MPRVLDEVLRTPDVSALNLGTLSEHDGRVWWLLVVDVVLLLGAGFVKAARTPGRLPAWRHGAHMAVALALTVLMICLVGRISARYGLSVLGIGDLGGGLSGTCSCGHGCGRRRPRPAVGAGHRLPRRAARPVGGAAAQGRGVRPAAPRPAPRARRPRGLPALPATCVARRRAPPSAAAGGALGGPVRDGPVGADRRPQRGDEREAGVVAVVRALGEGPANTASAPASRPGRTSVRAGGSSYWWAHSRAMSSSRRNGGRPARIS